MPLGWNINVHRQQTDGSAPAAFGAPQGTQLAIWQTGLGGRDWLDELVKLQKAIYLGGKRLSGRIHSDGHAPGSATPRWSAASEACVDIRQGRYNHVWMGRQND